MQSTIACMLAITIIAVLPLGEIASASDGPTEEAVFFVQ